MKDIKRLLGARIKSIRGAKKLTQEGLVEIMNINAVYLSNIERGMANPTLNMLIKIADALEVEMWEIFDFGHEVSINKLRGTLSNFAEEISEDKLGLAVKVLRALVR